MNLFQPPKPDAEGPVDNRGKVRFPRQVERSMCIEQFENARNAAKGNQGLENQQDAKGACFSAWLILIIFEGWAGDRVARCVSRVCS